MNCVKIHESANNKHKTNNKSFDKSMITPEEETMQANLEWNEKILSVTQGDRSQNPDQYQLENARITNISMFAYENDMQLDMYSSGYDFTVLRVWYAEYNNEVYLLNHEADEKVAADDLDIAVMVGAVKRISKDSKVYKNIFNPLSTCCKATQDLFKQTDFRKQIGKNIWKPKQDRRIKNNIFDTFKMPIIPLNPSEDKLENKPIAYSSKPDNININKEIKAGTNLQKSSGHHIDPALQSTTKVGTEKNILINIISLLVRNGDLTEEEGNKVKQLIISDKRRR